MTCESCRSDVKRVVLHQGALWCGPCHEASKGATHAHAVIGDDIPGGLWIENLQHRPLKFYSKHAIASAADARGLRFTDKWAGPSDQHLTNWGASIDAYTLAAAAELLTRRAVRDRPDVPDTVVCETAQFEVTVK